MTTKRDKKPWGRPNLIVLSRGESTESVLRACKYTGNVISSANNKANRCNSNTFCTTRCNLYWRT